MLSVVSSLYNRFLPKNYTYTGEIGLGGEIRHVTHIESRIKESILMGFKGIVLPFGQMKGLPEEFLDQIDIIGVKTIKDAVRLLQ